MALIEPSIGTVIGPPRRRLRSRAGARNVLDVTLASWKRRLKGPAGIHIFVRRPRARRAHRS